MSANMKSTNAVNTSFNGSIAAFYNNNKEF